MKHVKKVLSALVILSAISTAHAQQQMGGPGGGQDNGGPGGGGPGGGPGGPGGGPPDPQQMQEMMDTRIKSALGATDDTWSTLQPLIDKVTQLEHETDTGPLLHGRPHRPGADADANDGGPGGGGGGAQGAPADPGPGGQDAGPGGGGPGGGPGGDGTDAQDDDHPRSAVESAIGHLKKVLSDKSASDGKIQTAMKGAQDAEKKAGDDLEAARKELRNAVNLRQQAVLVALGVLN